MTARIPPATVYAVAPMAMSAIAVIIEAGEMSPKAIRANGIATMYSRAPLAKMRPSMNIPLASRCERAP